MRNISILLLLLSLFSSGLWAQDTDCSKFKTGKYFLPNEKGKEYLIHRKKKYQTEELEGDGTKMKFRVTWVDDCTYDLRFKKYVKNPKKLQSLPKDVVVRVEILEVYEDSYLQTSRALGVGPPKQAIMTKVKD